MTFPKTMKALQLKAPGVFEQVEVPVPEPRLNEALIRTRAVTICTSDLNDIAYNPFNIPLPRILGHEAAGTVAAIGEKIRHLRVGQRVAVHPVIPCQTCSNCRRGLGHLCLNIGHLGGDREGAYAEYFTIPEAQARLLPDEVPFAVGALLEPVCVCLEAMRRSRLSSGDRVLIVGDGPFGILIARLILRTGRNPIILIGRHEYRMSRVPGASHINAGKTPAIDEAIMQASGGDGVDAAILCVASREAVALCIRSLRARGRFVVFSAVPGLVPLDLFSVHVKELEIVGSCNDESCIDDAVPLLADSTLDLAGMVSHRYPFEQWKRGFDLCGKSQEHILKVALEFGDGA